MRRRNLVSAASALAAAPLLATTSIIVPQLAHAAEARRRSGEKVFLKDVKGKAKAFVKKGFYFKKFDDLWFKGDILILKFLFFGHFLVVEGIIFDVEFFDGYWRKVYDLEIDKAFFKAKADLRKEEDDHHWPWDARGKDRPPHDDDDCDLFLDIGWFKVIEFDDKDRYGSSITVFLLDPDEQELEIRDEWLEDFLCDKAKDDHDFDEKPEAEVELQQ